MKKIEQAVPKSYVERLIRTESAYMTTAAQIQSFKDLGCDGVEFLATLDEVTCETCGPLDGMHFTFDGVKEGATVPPMHPNCRCCLSPWYTDDEPSGYRGARNPETGKWEDVPDMKYDDWKDIFVDKNKTLEEWKTENSLSKQGVTKHLESSDVTKGQEIGTPSPNQKYMEPIETVNITRYPGDFAETVHTKEDYYKFVEKSIKQPDPNKHTKTAIYNFTIDSDFINSLHRSIRGTHKGKIKKLEMSAQKARVEFKNISKYIGHSELTKKLIVFRASNNNYNIRNIKTDAGVIEIYHDVVMTSATPLINAAVRFAQKWQLNTIYQIHLSPGKGKCADINRYSEKIDREFEILIRRNRKYKIIRKDTLVADGTEYIYITMEEM